jgi:hypothetical protein
MGQVDMRKVSGDAAHKGRVGEERGGGRVIGFTDGMNIMPGHCHRKVDVMVALSHRTSFPFPSLFSSFPLSCLAQRPHILSFSLSVI